MKRTIILLVAAILTLPCLMAATKQSETYNILKAIEAIQNQDYDTAIDALNAELEADAKNGYAYLWAAMIYANASDEYGTVLSYSDKALQYLPKKDNAYRSTAYDVRARAYYNLGKQENAIADISEAIKLDPKDVDFLNLRHQIYYEQGRYDLALADAKKITEVEPGNSLGFIALGRLADEQKDYQTALTNYDYAVKLDSDNSECYSYRASTYVNMSRWNDATDDIISALALDENDDISKDLFTTIADSAAVTLKTKLKIQAKKESNNALWPFMLGVMNMRKTDYREAVKYLEQSYRIEPRLTAAYGLSSNYAFLGQLNKALDYADRIQQLDSTSYSGIYCKAQAYYSNCRWADAEKAYTEYIDAQPDDPDGYLGRFDEAKRTIAEILPKADVQDFYNFACYHALFGDKQEAVAMLNKAVDKGFANLAKLEGDDDLNSLRQLDGFKKVAERVKALNAEDADTDADYQDETVEVPMTKDSGVYKVKCNINGLPLHFVFDTGASDITMSSVEASFMLKNNYLSAKDVVGSKNYQTANGDIIEGTMLNLRNVNFGGLSLDNVKASVVKTQNAPLLLGQSVLSRLGKVEIDYSKNVLRITHRVKK